MDRMLFFIIITLQQYLHLINLLGYYFLFTTKWDSLRSCQIIVTVSIA